MARLLRNYLYIGVRAIGSGVLCCLSIVTAVAMSNEATTSLEARTQVRSLERKLAALEVEHDLLKKAIRFNIERRRRNTSS
jgi:hypothetical protein